MGLSSEKFTSSKKECFIFGGNLKLQKQRNKSGSRSWINLLQSSLLLISFEAVFASYGCNSTSFQQFPREITIFTRIPSVNVAHPNNLVMLFLLLDLWHSFYEIMDCGRESLCDWGFKDNLYIQNCHTLKHKMESKTFKSSDQKKGSFPNFVLMHL